MKVYISKSEMGNPDLLMNLRHLLTHQFEQEIEIKEYFGGVYNSNIIDGSDCLIVCPPHYSIIGQYIIGKGQWSEIINAQKKDIPVSIFDGDASFDLLHKLTVIDETDWNAYAILNTYQSQLCRILLTQLQFVLVFIYYSLKNIKNEKSK